MITMAQEEKVRKLLNDTLRSNRNIASTIGVDDGAVKNIRRVMDAVNSTPPPKVDEIHRLFLSGLTPNAIATIARVSRSVVWAIRRFYYLQPRKPGDGGPRKCPTCGSMMFDARDKLKRLSSTDKKPPLYRIQEESLALHGIVDDVCKLDELCVVKNPAFFYLAKRARALLEKIHGESSGDR